MKKIFAILLIAILAMTTTAFAATYNYDNDIIFEYDENYFDISMDDHTDDEDLVILTEKNEIGFVKIHVGDLDDGETFPTLEDFDEMVSATDATVSTLETWANFTNVITYAYDVDNHHEEVFIAPVYDDEDPEIDGILTVTIGVDTPDDEAAAMAFSDQASMVVDTLRVDD